MSKLKANAFGQVWLSALCLWGVSLFVVADDMGVTVGVALSEALPHEVVFQRNRDYACTQCHQQQENQLSGAHGAAFHPDTERAITCVDCHTQITPRHRDGADDVIKFTAAQSQAGTEREAAPYLAIQLQNSQCEGCHSAESLREGHWTHDVHARSLTCASCHDVHPADDPVQSQSRESRIKTCVACHDDQRQKREESQ